MAFFERAQDVRQNRGVIYPMQISRSGAFLMKEEAHRSNIHFLLDFQRGAKFWMSEYGVDLDKLEQAGAELDTLLPVVTFQLRANVEDFVPRIGVDGIIVTRNLYGDTRTLRFDVVFRAINTNRVQRAVIDEDLTRRAFTPGVPERGIVVTNALPIFWESEPPPSIDPFLSQARASSEDQGYNNTAPLILPDVPTVTGQILFTMPQSTASATVSHGGVGLTGVSRRYASQVTYSHRQAGAWGHYYRAVTVVSSVGVGNLIEANWGRVLNSTPSPPTPSQLAMFQVVGTGAPGSRVLSNLFAVVQDGASSNTLVSQDLGISILEIPHTLEIISLPGSVRFFVDGKEEFFVTTTTLKIPPDVAQQSNVLHFDGEQIFGDDPPGSNAWSTATGFFTGTDGLTYYSLTAGTAEIRLLDSFMSYYNVPEDPTI